MSTSSRYRSLLIVICCLMTSSLRAVSAADVVPLELVADSAALCLEVPHLDDTWQRIEQSRLARRVGEFPPFQRLLSGAGFQQWMAIETFVGLTTGTSLSRHVRGMCAESLTLAIHLPAGGKPQGMVIFQARDEEAMTRSVTALGKLEPNLISESQQHLGHSSCRTKRYSSPSRLRCIRQRSRGLN
jgi:hypothetical protein